MDIPMRCYFFDFHTQPDIPDVGENFDAELVAKRLHDCGVGYVVFPARCNMGTAYYNTKIGIKHPSLKYDLFGTLVDACKRRGIGIGAYINAGLSHEEALNHRDWTVVSPEGYSYLPDRMNNFFRRMCYNTGYADRLVSMAEEVATQYPVDGFFFDCMGIYPCVGGECVKEMKASGMDWNDSLQQREFSHKSILRIADRLEGALHAIRPDLHIIFNGVEYSEQVKRGTYQEVECLPTGGWGYDCLPLMGRYACALDKPVVNMTGRFHRSWAEFGGLRAEASLRHDCLYGLALGMSANIGDHFHPRGDFNHDVFDCVERIYSDLKKLDPWTEGAKPFSEIGLVMPQPGFKGVELEAHTQAILIGYGAARLLSELNCQFDVLTTEIDWNDYSVLILADQVMVDEKVRAKLEKHLAQGGKILSSGFSGMDKKDGQFVLDEWGVEFTGEDSHDPAYMAVGEGVRDGIPEMPLCAYVPGARLKAREGTEVLAEEVAPYFDRHWNGEHHFFYLPPDKKTGAPVVTKNGNVVYVASKIFQAYYEQAYPYMKKLAGNLLKLLLPKPLVKLESFPSFGRAMVTRQPGRTIVHLLSYVPERRGQNVDVVEEAVDLHNVKLCLRCEDGQAKCAYLAPEKTELPVRQEDGYIVVDVPKISGSAIVVFENNA